ncbi:tissue factor pathway inhibitor 2 [Manacus vitellinus]|nr:tissue factor pathway inhibitor 2 [Manacus vitellinus]
MAVQPGVEPAPGAPRLISLLPDGGGAGGLPAPPGTRRRAAAAPRRRWPGAAASLHIKRCRRAVRSRSLSGPAAARPSRTWTRAAPAAAALLLPLACAALAQRSLTEKQRACLLPPDDGPCRALVPRWYYDRHTQSCQEFTYGGCYGNANNFLTFDDCEKNCWTIKKVPKLCRLEADGGPCRSYLRRYAFNLSSMRCEEFIYGGCYGNGNNFRDLQSCVDHCLPERTGPLLCYSPKDEGLCSSSVPRYYYDAKTKSCKEFKYTGCGGNANNFVTETDCYNVCRKGTQKPRINKPMSVSRRKIMRKLIKKPQMYNQKS